MLPYLLRKIFYCLLILVGVNMLTYALFFTVNSSDDIARMRLGSKHVNQEMVQTWKQLHGYDLPVFYAADQSGIEHWTQTLFWQQNKKLWQFNFGMSDGGRNINQDIRERMGPSLMIAVPSFILAIVLEITVALFMILFRQTRLYRFVDRATLVLISVSPLFLVIAGQYVFAIFLGWVPISGYAVEGSAIRFTVLPVLIAIVAGMGAGVRWYRGVLIDEIHKDYVKLARAKGLSEWQALWRHVLRNAMLPILTQVVVIIPSLFLGSLILESFFCIPGLGSYTIDAISQQDFAIVRSMVFLGTVLYLIGLLLTDISYLFADPRVKLQ